MPTTAAEMISAILGSRLEEDPANPSFFERPEVLSALREGLIDYNLFTEELTEDLPVTATSAFVAISGGIAPVHVRTAAEGKRLDRYTLEELDSQYPDWMNQSGTPKRWAPLGLDLIAVHPVPSSFNLTVTVLSLPSLADEAADVPLEDERLEALEQYALPYLRFKEGGAEFQQSLEEMGKYLRETGQAKLSVMLSRITQGEAEAGAGEEPLP